MKVLAWLGFAAWACVTWQIDKASHAGALVFVGASIVVLIAERRRPGRRGWGW